MFWTWLYCEDEELLSYYLYTDFQSNEEPKGWKILKKFWGGGLNGLVER